MENEKTRKDSYEQVRAEFQRLKLEERARFLVEATASTVMEGARRASESFSEEFDAWNERRQEKKKSSPDQSKTEKPGPAEPESPSGSKSSDT